MTYRDVIVASVQDVKEGEKIAVQVYDTELLLVKLEGRLYAMPGRCTHYGAPLVEGYLNGNRLVCPWHHACFDVRTGRQLEAPGMDGLPLFEVRTEGNDIILRLPAEVPASRPNAMVGRNEQDKRTFVVIGGGAAAAYAAEGMREVGFEGRILILTKEDDYAYDRPNCSKEYLSDEAPEEWMPLRDADFYNQHGIEWRKNSTVTRLDTDQKSIQLESGDSIAYDKVLIATGGIPRSLPIAGADSENVFLLRSLADSRHLRDAGKAGGKAVIIGASFIGMEGAMSLHKLGMEVDVVSPEDVPFAGVFGREVGGLILSVHEKAGIRFHLNTKAERFRTEGRRVTAVELDNGATLAADLVLVGIGVRPATDFVQGLQKADDGGLYVDEYLHAAKDVYAAGDIAYHPYRNRPVRIEHWKVACQHGRVAGRNMAGAREPYRMEPFFWTAQHDLNLRYVGHAEDFDRVVIDGKLEAEEPAFIAYYLKGNDVMAALGAGRDHDMAVLQEQLRAGDTDWKKWKRG